MKQNEMENYLTKNDLAAVCYHLGEISEITDCGNRDIDPGIPEEIKTQYLVDMNNGIEELSRIMCNHFRKRMFLKEEKEEKTA